MASGRATLGAGGRSLLELEERPLGRRDPDEAGLFHVALFQPDRAALFENPLSIAGLSR